MIVFGEKSLQKAAGECATQDDGQKSGEPLNRLNLTISEIHEVIVIRY